MKKIALGLSFALTALTGCSVESSIAEPAIESVDLSRSNAPSSEPVRDERAASRADEASSTSRDKPVCTPDTPPRQNLPATISAAAEAKSANYKAAFEAWSTDPLVIEAARVASTVVGKSCTKAADCDTGSTLVTAACSTPYYNQSQCYVNVSIPGAPIAPKFLCGTDFICPAGFECEQEENTGAAACVEHRTCIEPGAPSGGGRGGRR